MEKRHLKPGTLLAPVPPALITVRGTAGVNVMTAAWCGILCSDPPMTYVSVRPTRWTHAILTETREFVINLPRARDAKKVDFCGIYTGAKINKMEKCGFHEVPGTVVAAPGIAECPVNLECRVTEIRQLGTHDCFVAEIVAVNADEELFDDGGKLHMERADLLAYAHGGYYGLGRRLGDFGFSARKKKRGGDGKKTGGGRYKRAGNGERAQATAAVGDTSPDTLRDTDLRKGGTRGGGKKKKNAPADAGHPRGRRGAAPGGADEGDSRTSAGEAGKADRRQGKNRNRRGKAGGDGQ